jgi:hypothetical protein
MSRVLSRRGLMATLQMLQVVEWKTFGKSRMVAVQSLFRFYTQVGEMQALYIFLAVGRDVVFAIIRNRQESNLKKGRFKMARTVQTQNSQSSPLS